MLARGLYMLQWFVDLEEPKRSGSLYKMVRHRNFELMCAFVILLNSVFLAEVANYDVRNLGQPSTSFIYSVDLAFALFFLAELILRLAVHRLYFFINDHFKWNLFDLVLVLLSFYDQLVLLMDGIGGANVGFMRTLRILKIAKLLRMVRVLSSFRDLRIMLHSIVGSVGALFWCFVMLGFILYVFALVFVQATTTALIVDLDSEHLSDPDKDLLLGYYGTVQHAILTLFMSATGGTDWIEPFQTIGLSGFAYSACFIFFIGFFQFAVFNILTGLFVENAMKLAQPDHDTLIFEQRRRELADVEDMKRFCAAMDVDGSGTISLGELMEFLDNAKARAYLQLKGLDVTDAEMFFFLLASANGSDSVDIDAFAEGAMKMRGQANAMDIQTVLYETKRIKQQHEFFANKIETKLDTLSRAVAQPRS
eukprot:gnl/TRDRNA2_/TRDRNA2_130080_c0_seq4.p1 gnl/TRDRNA2_/TRDRNA2_130080_c0~~gnl/TRDRNA2_/TRDRNA2_130080_c0_seq4.p1  ORF type:complete len:422 (+),score=59.40 gnl/TRDRNA2_/TRDRNA2_130080_c0_seq4:193-1458(+)